MFNTILLVSHTISLMFKTNFLVSHTIFSISMIILPICDMQDLFQVIRFCFIVKKKTDSVFCFSLSVLVEIISLYYFLWSILNCFTRSAKTGNISFGTNDTQARNPCWSDPVMSNDIADMP